MSRLKQLGKDSIIYGVGGVMGKGISFFLLPVYTRIFPPADYGAIEMLTVLTALLSAVLGLGMDSAQSMFFFKEKGAGVACQAKVVSSILQWRLMWGWVVILIVTLLAPVLNASFFSDKLDWTYFAVAFVGALATQVMGQSIEVLRLLYRPWPYVAIMVAQNLAAAAATLGLVLVFRQGIFGYFLGATLASILAACVGWWLVRPYLNFSEVHWRRWPMLLHFGAPLLLSDLAFYLMNTTDRWFVREYCGEAELGVYALGAKMAMLVALAVETFRKAWWPIAMDAMHSQDGPESYRMIARLFSGVATSGVVMLTLMSPWLVEWFAAPAYRSAWPIVGILAWPSVFYGFYLVASAGIWKSEKTYLSAVLMVSSAMLNIVLNYVFVPKFGTIGAALATAITYFLWVAVAMVLSEMLWKIGFPLRIMCLHLTVALLTGYWLIAMRGGDFDVITTVVAVMISAVLFATAIDRSARIALLHGIGRFLTRGGGVN